ncbi:MAG: type VI secretion system tip protein VgrG [Roseobacter sp.]
MADSPTQNTEGPLFVSIKMNGTEIPDTAMISSVEVTKEIGRIPEALVVIRTGSVPQNDFSDMDGKTFALGAEIEISTGYGDGTGDVLFKGILFKKNLIVRGEEPFMSLLCRDKAHLMTIVPANGQYQKMKDSDIMSEIISDAGLKATVSATSSDARDQLRHNARDWDYLRALADRNQQIVIVSDGEVTIDKPDPSSAPVLSLTLGFDVLEMNTSVSAMNMADEATLTAWDDSAQETVKEQSAPATNPIFGNQTASDLTAASGSQKFAATTSANYASDVLKAASTARIERSVLQTMGGTVKFLGNSLPLPGKTIEVKGAGDVFGGNAFIGKVEHILQAGEWSTEVTIGAPQTWRADEFALGGSSAAALTAPVQGLHIGKVTQIVGDPDDRLRIEVNIPVHDGEETLVWARFATPYSTVEAGIFFMPEIDDEVVVGFLSSDPDNPVVLGALHNGTTAQPYAPDEENTFKAIVTKNELKIEFEDVKKVITISTPGGNIVTLDDDAVEITLVDTTGNEIKMTGSGIDMTSPGDINITADGNVAISATGNASIEGANVDVTAQAQLTAKGSAGAELSASGQTVVKGSIVMIN